MASWSPTVPLFPWSHYHHPIIYLINKKTQLTFTKWLLRLVNNPRTLFSTSKMNHLSKQNMKMNQSMVKTLVSSTPKLTNILDFSVNNHTFPVKFEVKNEDDQPSSSLHHRSKKITKERPKGTSSPHQSGQIHKNKGTKKKTRQTWTLEEEIQVVELMKKHGKKWSKIASCMRNRNGKQVRDHYLNSLAPDINRGVWTEDEDQAILFFYEKFGAQWCKIAECVPGRTETSVKGRFYTNLKQKKMMKCGAKVEILFEKNDKDDDGFWK